MFSTLKKIVMWVIAVCFGLFIIMFSLANRTPVEVDVWPLPITQEIPLFGLLLACLGFGILWGGVGAWLSAGKARKRARTAVKRAEAAEMDARHHEERNERLEQELRELTAQEKTRQEQVEGAHVAKLPPAEDAA